VRKPKLTKAELRAMGAGPGLMAHRVGPDGRSRQRSHLRSLRRSRSCATSYSTTRADDRGPSERVGGVLHRAGLPDLVTDRQL
jgi:hypothetical protein